MVKIGDNVVVKGVKGIGKVTYIRYDGNTQKVSKYRVKYPNTTAKYYNRVKKMKK